MLFSLVEVQKHNTSKDAWIIVDNNVYDVTHWANKHPGGPRIIQAFAGQDATDAIIAFHPKINLQKKIMACYQIGKLENPNPESALISDFRDLREKLMKEGYFKSSPLFYSLCLFQVIFLEIIAMYISYNYGLQSWPIYLICAFLMAAGQAQAGWLQHDFGHLSVFKEADLKNHQNSIVWRNIFWHWMTICFLKGASSSWWRFRHNQHHAKPNIIHKDPDLKNDPLFIFGRKMAELKMGWALTKHQHNYWWFFGPPLVTSFYFVLTNYYYVFKWKLFREFIVAHLYFIRTYVFYYLIIGSWIGMFKFYFFMRVIESMWFTWVSAMNHFPMTVDLDKNGDWVHCQLAGTQNLPSTYFSNWFTGHLSHQIEHHLFPTMPRHNYPKVAPFVRKLCEKHGIGYKQVGMSEACWGVVRALKEAAKVEA